jgi:hypothetical protein
MNQAASLNISISKTGIKLLVIKFLKNGKIYKLRIKLFLNLIKNNVKKVAWMIGQKKTRLNVLFLFQT